MTLKIKSKGPGHGITWLCIVLSKSDDSSLCVFDLVLKRNEHEKQLSRSKRKKRKCKHKTERMNDRDNTR